MPVDFLLAVEHAALGVVVDRLGPQVAEPCRHGAVVLVEVVPVPVDFLLALTRDSVFVYVIDFSIFDDPPPIVVTEGKITVPIVRIHIAVDACYGTIV